MKHLLRTFLPAILLCSAAGCGGDEPALRDMTDQERAQQAEKQRAYQEEQMKAQMATQQKGNQYKNSAAGGS